MRINTKPISRARISLSELWQFMRNVFSRRNPRAIMRARGRGKAFGKEHMHERE